MAQLSALQLLSSASYVVGRWQLQQRSSSSSSVSASVNLKARPLSIRMQTNLVITRPVEEPSPKELHHLRKKEAQKKIRKIRKERRAKRRAENLAKIPSVKPNPAMLRFERPLRNWNKPWKKKKKRVAVQQQTDEFNNGLGFDERKIFRAFRSDSNREDFTSSPRQREGNSEPSQPVRIAWSEFEAVYEEKMRKSADKIAHGKISDKAVRTGEFGVGYLRFTDGSDEVRKFRSETPLSKLRTETGATGSNGGEDGLAVVRGVNRGGEDELNARGNSQMTNVDQLSSKLLSRSREERLSFVSSAQYLNSVENKQKDCEAMRQSFRIGRESEGGVNSCGKISTPSIQAKQSIRESGSGQIPSSAGQEIETSEFWDRRDMLLNETFDDASLRKKFESSAESKKFIWENRTVEPKTFRREVARVVVGQRKSINVYLSTGDDDAAMLNELPRSDLDEDKQLEWLAKQLDRFARPDGVHLSKLMRSGGLKITDGRALTLVQRLGELDNWRCALQVVEWLNSRNHFPPVRSRYLFTALLAVLGKARRPIESLNVFNVMREHVATYPDLPAYHVIAVTLGQAGYMEELFELMQSLRQGPARTTKYLLMLADQGRLIPDIVVYNAALNSCVPHKHWRCALWILDELYKDKNLWPNSASYGLAIEVMVKSRKYDLAWKTLEKMELEGFHPNSSTYKILVEGLGQVGKADLAVEMVKQMEERGMVALPGVYYALACTLCMSGRWKDALLQVDRLVNLSKRPIVETYTGLIKACKEAGHWRDAISVYDHMREVCAPDIGTYNIMISIYGRNKMYGEAKKLFDQIKTGLISSPKMYRRVPRLSPDRFTYDAILGSCAVSEKWEDMEVLFRQMLLQGFQLNCKRHTWIVQASFTAGKDDLVETMFTHLRSLNFATSEVYVVMINSCVRGGEQDKAFRYLKEMVDQDMRITMSDLQKFQEMKFLLSEEERLNFISKVEGLIVSSDFNFRRRGSPSLHQQSTVLKLPKSRNALSSILHKSQERMNVREHAKNSQNSKRSSSLLGSHERSTNHVLSPGNVNSLVRNDWPLKGYEEDLGNQQPRQGDQISDSPNWELIWRNSSYFH